MTAKRAVKPARRPPQPPALPVPADRRRFRDRLLTWYRRHGRDLPWRKTSDPYHILVSEIMLQQTQVDRVLPKYAEWLDKYPSLEALATAPEQEVTDAWYPLGYNIRPRRLQTIARESVARYGGRLPADEETLLSFKGIGAYTAGAIRSFAFRERAAILDTNVARVLFRVFVGQRRSEEPRDETSSLARVGNARARFGTSFDFNQALMDFGAMVCVARNPKCLVCPMAKSCRAFPFDPDRRLTRSMHDRRRGRGHRTRRSLSADAPSAGRPSRGLLGISRREVRARRDARRLPGARDSRGARRRRRGRRASCSRRPMRIRIGGWSCTSCAASSAGRPAPQLGQEMRWVARDELATLAFPPADAELIRAADQDGLD